MLPWLEIASMFPHCALSWCQYFHIVRWVGVNVSRLCAGFPHRGLIWCQLFHMKNWLLHSAQCGNIDMNSAYAVETLTRTQRMMWIHWHQKSARSGNIDTNSAHNVETLTRFHAKVARAFENFGLFLANNAKNQNLGYMHDHSAQYIKNFATTVGSLWSL